MLLLDDFITVLQKINMNHKDVTVSVKDDYSDWESVDVELIVDKDDNVKHIILKGTD